MRAASVTILSAVQPSVLPPELTAIRAVGLVLAAGDPRVRDLAPATRCETPTS